MNRVNFNFVPSGCLTLRQVADLASLSYYVVCRARREGLIKDSGKVGREYVVREVEARRFIRDHVEQITRNASGG